MASARASSAVGVAYQIPRNSLALLMFAQVVVVLPFALQLSPWIIAVGLFCGYWRAGVYQGRWSYPHRWVKALLVVASVVGVAVSGAGAFSLETAASLLILAFALKLIEMKSRRDAYLVIFLAYFVIATEFLFDQSILVAVYELGAICVVTAAMVGLNQLHTRVRPLASLRDASKLVLQALPFTLVLFLFFPRIAPLWTVPLPTAGKTGITDVVKPGAIASLTQSDDLAFRVVFDGEIPRNRDLYWRGLVYSEYKDGAWSVGPELPAVPRALRPEPEPEEGGVSYEVLLEPTMSDWLFALDTAFPRSAGVAATQDYRLRSRDPILSVFRYGVASYPDFLMDEQLTRRLITRETKIDLQDSPRAVALARSMYAGDDERYVDDVLAMIREQPFRYTLNPPTLPDSGSIDAFWFDSRAGFCTHYAGAFVYLMRAVGIPARMVGGYQGGEVNPISNHLMVRQYDAHAWAEVWFRGQGWRRVDPTAAVAPDRIERGLSAALSANDRASLSALTSARLGEWSALADMLYRLDSLEHRWNLWVIGYDSHFQAGFLERLLGKVTPGRTGLVMLAAGAASIGLVAFFLFWRRRPRKRHPVERMFLRFAGKVAGYGLCRDPEESPGAFVRRAARNAGWQDEQADQIVAQMNALMYNPAVSWGRAEVASLGAQLRRLQFRLAFASAR